MDIKKHFTDEELIELYDDFLENHLEQAPQAVKKSYAEMREAFDEYLNAVQEHMSLQAFKFGYMRGLKENKAKALE